MQIEKASQCAADWGGLVSVLQICKTFSALPILANTGALIDRLAITSVFVLMQLFHPYGTRHVDPYQANVS